MQESSAGVADISKPSRVLVIDDDPAAQAVISRTLTRSGFQVEVVSDSSKAIQTAREQSPRVITLDIDMPGTDGWTIIAALKADPQLANVPVVIISSMDEKNRGIGAGAIDYLVKPLDRSRLLTVVQSLASAVAKAPVESSKVVASDAGSTPPKSVAAPSPAAGRPRRILVVEDDNTTRSILSRMLQKEGLTVVEASSGRSALAVVAKEPPDLILLDLGLPEIDGFEFLRELRAVPQGRSVPVVIISAKDLSTEEKAMLRSAVLKIHQKGTYSRADLLDDVRNCLSQNTRM